MCLETGHSPRLAEAVSLLTGDLCKAARRVCVATENSCVPSAHSRRQAWRTCLPAFGSCVSPAYSVTHAGPGGTRAAWSRWIRAFRKAWFNAKTNQPPLTDLQPRWTCRQSSFSNHLLPDFNPSPRSVVYPPSDLGVMATSGVAPPLLALPSSIPGNLSQASGWHWTRRSEARSGVPRDRQYSSKQWLGYDQIQMNSSGCSFLHCRFEMRSGSRWCVSATRHSVSSNSH